MTCTKNIYLKLVMHYSKQTARSRMSRVLPTLEKHCVTCTVLYTYQLSPRHVGRLCQTLDVFNAYRHGNPPVSGQDDSRPPLRQNESYAGMVEAQMRIRQLPPACHDAI